MHIDELIDYVETEAARMIISAEKTADRIKALARLSASTALIHVAEHAGRVYDGNESVKLWACAVIIREAPRHAIN